MAKMEFRKRYLGTLLGSVWAILFPLVNIGLIYLVMTHGLKVGVDVGAVGYADWLIPGMLAWFFVSEMLLIGVNAVTDNSHLVTKIRFPLRLLIPSRILSAFPVHCILMALFTSVLAIQGKGSIWYWLQLPYYALCAAMLALGVNYLTAAAQVFARDVSNIVGMLLQMLFWVTPIFWNPSLIAETKFRFLLYSPFAYVITGYRDSLFDAVPFWERPMQAFIFWAGTLLLLVLGMNVFQRVRPHFADVL